MEDNTERTEKILNFIKLYKAKKEKCFPKISSQIFIHKAHYFTDILKFWKFEIPNLGSNETKIML